MESPTFVLETQRYLQYHTNHKRKKLLIGPFAVNTDAAQITPHFPVEGPYTLSRNVSAIQLLPAEQGEVARLGLLTQLPEGAEVHFGGPGFNERTVKVRSGAATYFVFLEDLEPQRKPAARAVIAGG